jgi:hypothetical protein
MKIQKKIPTRKILMIPNGKLKRDILALFFLSVGGLLLHLRIHPLPGGADNPQNPANIVPFVFCLLGTIAVPVLLCSARTYLIGYLINGMGVIIGTIIMGHMSISAPPELSASGILLGTSLSYILLLLPKLFIGQNVLLHYRPAGMGRMFTPAWWLRHFCYLAVFYAIGHFIWR